MPTGAGAPDPIGELAAALENSSATLRDQLLRSPPALDGHLAAAGATFTAAPVINSWTRFPPARAPVAGWTPTGCCHLRACSSPAGGTHGGIAAPISAAGSRKCRWPAAATSGRRNPPLPRIVRSEVVVPVGLARRSIVAPVRMPRAPASSGSGASCGARGEPLEGETPARSFPRRHPPVPAGRHPTAPVTQARRPPNPCPDRPVKRRTKNRPRLAVPS